MARLLVFFYRLYVIAISTLHSRSVVSEGVPPLPPPADPAPPAPPPDSEAIPDPPPPWQPNRAQRRKLGHLEKLEKTSRKGVWVDPKGPKPVTEKRAPRQQKPRAQRPVETGVDDDGDDRIVAEPEIFGQFYFRDTILDQLERYFVYIDRMKKGDPEAYKLYTTIGAHIVPCTAIDAKFRKPDPDEDVTVDPSLNVLSPWWKKNRPSFGCVVYGADTYTEKNEAMKFDRNGKQVNVLMPKFMYFTKYEKPPPCMQRILGGDTYKMSIWWDKPSDPKHSWKKGSVQEFGVWVSEDGEDIYVLKSFATRTARIRTKQGPDRGKEFTIPDRGWRIPDIYHAWAAEHGVTAEQYLAHIFTSAANMYEKSQYSMVRVAVLKDDLAAVFGIDMKRVPYFFQDRDITLTDSGRKQRAFHIVRPHQRKDGSAVKMHFRGLKKFEWAGYQVQITVPGRDHLSFCEFDVAGDDEYWMDKQERKEGITNEVLGKGLRKFADEGIGGTKRPLRKEDFRHLGVPE